MRRATSCASGARTSTASTPRSACAIDPQDNVWTIDAAANQVVKFNADGSVALVLGRKPETIGVRPNAAARQVVHRPVRALVRPRCAAEVAAVKAAAGRAPGSGIEGSGFNRPTDVAWDKAGNIYVADGIGTNNRIAKLDKDGRFIRHWGSTGSGPGQFSGVKAIALDAQGNVYAADAGNKRIQVFDGDGKFLREFGNVGTPLAMCMTRGATQYLYVSHAGDQDGMDDAAIYKVHARRQGGRQVRIGRQAAEGIRPRQFNRLPQRERAADRRDDELACPEGEPEIVPRTRRYEDTERT